MNKKQRNRRNRIAVSLVCFVALMMLEHLGALKGLNGFTLFIIYFIPYIIVGNDVIIKAAKNISNGQVFDENFLMMIATFAAFGLGIFGDAQYSEALAVMLFYQMGEAFQDYAVGQSRASIAEMMEIAPESAFVLSGDETEEVDPEDVEIGSIVIVRPGDKVPLDGIVIEGESFLDTSALTGESVPRRVSEGDDIISGCVNGEGMLKVRVTKEYDDSTVAKILELVENASARKAVLENFVTRFARVYTPIVTISAVLLAVAMPLMFNLSWADGIERACNFLIVSCPCALVISVPLGFFGGIGAASKIGVLVKGSNFLEAAAGLDTMVFDKTGTLTKGEFRVSKLVPAKGVSQDELLEFAAYGEVFATHPIGKSILDAAKSMNLDKSRLEDIHNVTGRGTSAKLDGKMLLVGSRKLLIEHGINGIGDEHSSEMGTLTFVAYDGNYKGYIVIADAIKEGAEDSIAKIKCEGVNKAVMLTGDRRAAAEAVAQTLGLDAVKYELLPADKIEEVEKLITKSHGRDGKLGYVGDGINDAPVLMRADVGFAMGSLGSDAAIEAADIVLMDDDLSKLPIILKIAKRTMRIVKSNIAFAIGVKIIILLLSAFGIASMWMAVFGDVGVSIICIINSMRVLKFKQ
ncbi:heavy metal translocating P-type ATPase [Mogibacterium pumilum]|uniref:Cd(2+)-exporting ATPase n=1 Tax=Mogibacterium pumilum TaxID=86332 RepID=A0A223AS09_9FIRM|nr:heavy metal translocating P-type ATPase [Mogibacterium pumilum]ASS37722.1 cadmium-translocating P-type ATPase [Mogibacterium pumilum]